jgi:hypothetical protein
MIALLFCMIRMRHEFIMFLADIAIGDGFFLYEAEAETPDGLIAEAIHFRVDLY